MDSSLQPVLSCGEGVLSDISVFLNHGGTDYEVYLGVALLERVGADPESVARKMLVGRLYNAGVPVGKLRDTFRHDPRTISKWGAALLSADIGRIARAFAGRAGERKVSPELIRYTQQLYRGRHILGRNYREVIIGKIAEVFGVRISTTTVSGIFASAGEACSVRNQAGNVATDSPPEPDLASGQSSSVKQSPTPLPAQVAGPGGGRQWIHHAGQVLFAEGMKGIEDPLQRQFVGQILQGAVNVEQSKTLCGRSLANFTGPVVNDLKEQRDGLDGQACSEEVIRAYERNAELLCDGPNRGDLFYFDPHTKEYTGQLNVLKGWCGRRHGVAKSINLDSFHTRSGRPCFIRHYSPYYDMRERFFMSLVQFDLLFDPDKRRGRTFVIDRGIYSLPTLQAFGSDYVITWEKNYSGGGWDDSWPAIAFNRSVPKNSRGDLRTTRFQCQLAPWRRDPSFRRIVVRATREDGDIVQASVITSHPEMDVQDVVWAIFRRWLQENDFKYLDTHFGINQLTSRDSFAFLDRAEQFEDRPVDSPEYRELKKAVNALETELGKLLVRLRKAEKQEAELEVHRAHLESRRSRLTARMEAVLDRLRNERPAPPGSRTIRQDSVNLRTALKQNAQKVQQNAENRERLQIQIRRTEEQIEPLEVRLCDAVRKQSRVQLLLDGNYRMLDTRKKALMDALRVTASNIFRNVQEKFRAICDNFRDDHVLVRMLSRCSGTMEKTVEATTFQLWLPGTLQPHRVRDVQTLLEQVEQQTNTEIRSVMPVRIELLSGPISL